MAPGMPKQVQALVLTSFFVGSRDSDAAKEV